MRDTLKGLKNGPLSKEVAVKIDAIWKLVEGESPLNNGDAQLAMEKK